MLAWDPPTLFKVRYRWDVHLTGKLGMPKHKDFQIKLLDVAHIFLRPVFLRKSGFLEANRVALSDFSHNFKVIS